MNIEGIDPGIPHEEESRPPGLEDQRPQQAQFPEEVDPTGPGVGGRNAC